MDTNTIPLTIISTGQINGPFGHPVGSASGGGSMLFPNRSKKPYRTMGCTILAARISRAPQSSNQPPGIAGE